MSKNQRPEQLSLAVSLRDDATFGNFLVEDGNRLLLEALYAFAKGEGDLNLLLWGREGSGLTHLLQSCVTQAERTKKLEIHYIPLKDMLGHSASEVLEGLDTLDLLCLDDIDCIAGNSHWERELFHLYNRLRDRGGRLLLASHNSPAGLKIELADLKSRVCGSVVYAVQTLSDEAKITALQLRAKNRGMDMSPEVANYIYLRSPRGNRDLFKTLDLLDEATLQEKRLLSIPFVKTILGF